MANLITGCRMILSLIMVSCPTNSCAFFFCYLAAGFTDMIDGAVARARGTTSAFGAKLDTASDMFFAASLAYKLLPVLNLSIGVWIWTGVIACIKVINIISGYLIKKQFVSVHTRANKATGLMLFLLPVSLGVVDIKYSAIVVCIVATYAAVQEGHFIRTRE